MIVEWWGTLLTIPDGWALCDGANGTPDLRDDFILCAGDSFDPADEGGSMLHTHSFSGNGHGHQLVSGTDIASGSGRFFLASMGAIWGTSSNNDQPPPYYALAYIMKL